MMALVFSGLSMNVTATGIPTVDVANILQTTTTAFENIDQTINQVTQIQKQVEQIQQFAHQIEQMERQWKSMSGSYALGALLNTLADRQKRRYLPTDWAGVLDLGQEVLQNAQTSAVAEEAKKVREQGERYTKQELFHRSPNSPAADRYNKTANSIYGSMAIGRESYKRTEDRLDTIEQLSEAIDTSTDIKAATDLNNRLLVELAVLMTESIRIQSASQIQYSEDRHSRLDDDAQLRRWVSDREDSGLISIQ